jgi:PAS domain S-box-containing protein
MARSREQLLAELADLRDRVRALEEPQSERKGRDIHVAQERFSYVLAVCPAIVYITQATGDYACTFVSENIREILGFEQQEMLEDPEFWTTHLHPQDTRRVLADMFQLIPRGGGTLEYRFRHRDGHYRWFQDTFRTIFDAKGQPAEIVGAWADITQRKLADSFQVLFRASLQIQAPQGLRKSLDEYLRMGREVLELDRLTILLTDTEEQWLQAVASTETDEPIESVRLPLGPAGGALAQAYLTQKPIVCEAQTPLDESLRLKPPYDQIKSFRSRAFAIIPLVVHGHAIGVLAADRKRSRAGFDPSTLEPLELLASQVAIASEHARLQAASQPLLRRSLDLNDVYPAFANAVQALLPYDRIGVVVPEGKQLTMALSIAEPPLESWQGQSWTEVEGTAGQWILDQNKPRLVRDLALERNFSDEEFAFAEGVRSTIMLPLVAGAEVVGFFFLDSRTPSAYTERDIDLLTPVAQQLALAIQNTRLLRELQGRTSELARSIEEMNVLREVGQAVSSTLELPTVLTTIVAHAVQLSGADAGVAYEYDEEAKQFSLRATHGMDEELVAALRKNPIGLGEGAVGRAAVERTPIQVPDIEEQSFEARLQSWVTQSGFRAILSIPLLLADRIIGGLSVCRRSPGEFQSRVIDLLQMFGMQSVIAIHNARLFHEVAEKGHQLEIASRHKSQFLANMSHELRTPLNAIVGYTELLLDNIYGDIPGKARDALGRVDKNSRHLLGLINDILDLSKIEAGPLTMSVADYSMGDVVQAVVNVAEPLTRDKQLVLKVKVAPGLARARGDERRTTQVLLNLVGNAIKFTETGEIRLEVGADERMFQVTVADTGPGIPTAEQEKIFEEFHQAEDSHVAKKGGTGLGLAIAKRIIELQGGRIWVESTPGKGSVFRFTLPVRVERNGEAI